MDPVTSCSLMDFDLLPHAVTISGMVSDVCFKEGRNYEVYREL